MSDPHQPYPARREQHPAPRTLDKRVLDLIADADAPNTLRAYRSDLRCWAAWCDRSELDPEPPFNDETVALYVAHLESLPRRPSTIARRIAALGRVARANGLTPPAQLNLVRLALRGCRRRSVAQRGSRPREAPPLTLPMIRLGCRRLHTHDTAQSLRDRCLLLVGFAAALRRSELVALDWPDALEHPDGRLLRLWGPKTEGDGYQLVGLARATSERADLRLCPVACLSELYQAQGRPLTGPIFKNRAGRRLSPQSVTTIVRRMVGLVGEDPRIYSSHSLRAGLATEVSRLGVDQATWMRHTRHASATVAARYARPADAVQSPAARIVSTHLTALGS